MRSMESSLIYHNWVITGAHCNSGLFGLLRVILGEHNLKIEEMVAIDSSFVESEPVIRKVKQISNTKRPLCKMIWH
jgi:hypothetical protein